MSSIELAVGGNQGYVDRQLVRYVDYVGGSDSNRGLTPGLPFKNIQAAIDDLEAVAAANYTIDANGRLGVGEIILLPGDHVLGSALLPAWNRPLTIRGTRSGPRSHDPQNSASRIVSNSAAVTEFVYVPGAVGEIMRGLAFENIAFRMDHTVNTALARIIYCKRVGYLTVDRCSFTNADGVTNANIHAILHDDATDSSGEGGWLRLRDNAVSRMGLYRCTTGGAGGNFNRGRIQSNVVFYGGTLPMIHLDATVNNLFCDGNNLEGTAVGIEIGPNGSNTSNTFAQNGGEDPSTGTPPNPYIKLSGSVSQQLFIGGICSSPLASGYGVYVEFGANAYRNIVIGVLDLTNVSTTHKRKIVETSHADKNTLIPMNVAIPTYTATNVTTDRSFDADTVAVAELADVVGTLIADLRARGWAK